MDASDRISGKKTPADFSAVLWRIYNRPDPSPLWQNGGNLPWNDPDFSARMLREHLDESHGAASRQAAERAAQLDWLWAALRLEPGSVVLDLTCGPGLYAVPLAERGCRVTGVDFGPASIAYARQLASAAGVDDRCTFIEQDVRLYEPPAGQFDAVLFLYGQLAVFPPEDAAALLCIGSVIASLRRPAMCRITGSRSGRSKSKFVVVH
jgi:SAM-dependent methyltransferase